MAKDEDEEDTAPGKRYVTRSGIILVTLYLTFVTTAGSISGLLFLWPSCINVDNIPAADAPTIDSISPASGTTQGGTALIIRGSGFSDGMKVKFGKNNGKEISVVNTNLLTVYSPEHQKGLVDITLLYPNGTTRVLSLGYYYFDPADQLPKPSIGSLSPISGPPTGGQIVTIKGKDFQNVTQVRFDGLPVSNIQIWDDSSITVTTPPHSQGTVDVTVYVAGATAVLSSSYTYTCWSISPVDLFFMVIFAGALGGSLHGIRSLIWHVGKCDLRGSWLLKYYLLPISGASIAVIFYLASLAGFYSLESTGNQILIGLSALVGMFSAQAAEKLKSIAEGLLTRPQDSSQEYNALLISSDGPSIISIKPSTGSIDGNTEVIILGAEFNEGAIVCFGANQVLPKKISQGLISVHTPPHDPGKVDVFVINPNGRCFIVRNGYEYVAKISDAPHPNTNS